MRHRPLTCLLVLVAAAVAQSEPPDVGITGVVIPTPGPIGCGLSTHLLTCTDVFLYADDPAKLDAVVGHNVKLLGNEVPVPGVTCHLIKVSEVEEPPPATLVACGSFVPGCTVKFVICPGGLSQFGLWVALDQGYKPITPLKGTWLLGEPFFLIALGFDGAACHEVVFDVPAMPILVDVPVWFQAARREIGPVGPLQLTNVECVTLQPGGPCVSPGC